VRRLLKPGALAPGMAPVGTLADFLEVSGEYEGVVDEFLRDELNFVVVKSWGAAEEGVRLLKSGVDGRATFLIHDGAQGVLFEENVQIVNVPGADAAQGLHSRAGTALRGRLRRFCPSCGTATWWTIRFGRGRLAAEHGTPSS
jgi:hypothetical protein